MRRDFHCIGDYTRWGSIVEAYFETLWYGEMLVCEHIRIILHSLWFVLGRKNFNALLRFIFPPSHFYLRTQIHFHFCFRHDARMDHIFVRVIRII